MGQNGARSVRGLFEGRQVLEGAGVRLRRVIGGLELDRVDPFLLLDEFHSDDPDDYIAGFPWHPHRGIETVTYMVRGQVRHGDSIGNVGVIGPGDVQWMTAGHGIIHEEMPEQRDGTLWGFQLWVNLPARDKLCDPRYQEIGSERIPSVELGANVRGRVVAGELAGATGPVGGIAVDPLYCDLVALDHSSADLPLPPAHSAFVYVYHGAGRIGGREVVGPRLALLGEGDRLQLSSDEGMRVLLVAGRPLGEPVARGGPFVMNTPEEIAQAFRDYREGRLLKDQGT